MDPSLSFHKHFNYVSDRIDKRNNMLKALAGSSWRQEKETLLRTYNALGKSIASYAAPVWSTNAIQQNRRSYTNYRKADLDKFTQDTEDAFTALQPPTDIHDANKTFTNILYQAGKKHIPVGIATQTNSYHNPFATK